VYALALLRFRPPRPWCEALVGEVQRQMGAFGAQELSNLVWALAVLGLRPGRAWMRDFQSQVRRAVNVDVRADEQFVLRCFDIDTDGTAVQQACCELPPTWGFGLSMLATMPLHPRTHNLACRFSPTVMPVSHQPWCPAGAE
jgi:hypothetical protein